MGKGLALVSEDWGCGRGSRFWGAAGRDCDLVGAVGGDHSDIEGSTAEVQS